MLWMKINNTDAGITNNFEFMRKAGLGDRMYSQRLKKIIFHMYAMQPHPAVNPGMTMGPWGWMHSISNSWVNRVQEWLTKNRIELPDGMKASDWKTVPSGLLGPVRLIPLSDKHF
jgi:hypothetical protein